MEPQELTVLGLIHTEVLGVRADLKAFHEELTKTREKVAVLDDRSNRMEDEARGASLWGKSGMVAGLFGLIPLLRELARALGK